MINFFESKKVEIYLLSFFIITVGIVQIDIPYKSASLVISLAILLFLYFIRAIISFRQWKFSKGISVLNSYLNFQLFCIIEAIGFTFLKWPGHSLLTYNAITSPQFFIIFIGIFILIRWTKLNRRLYWERLKENTYKVLIGIFICLILYYTLNMSSNFNNYPPTDIGFPLPKKLF